MSIERFHEKMVSATDESPLFKALRKLRRLDAADAFTSGLLWASW